MYQSFNSNLFPTQEGTRKFIGRRKRLIEELRRKGIASERVLDAMEKTPRELFMSPTLIELSYNDSAYPIGVGQTISQPSTVAKQTTLLDLKGGEKILEVGTGSGYQAAVLANCGCDIYTMERQKTLYERTSVLLKRMFPDTVHCFLADGFGGLPQESPFDRVIVTAGCSEMPKDLLLQLKVGGIAVLPYGEKSLHMLRIFRKSEAEFEQVDCGDCSFVPMLKGVER